MCIFHKYTILGPNQIICLIFLQLNIHIINHNPISVFHVQLCGAAIRFNLVCFMIERSFDSRHCQPDSDTKFAILLAAGKFVQIITVQPYLGFSPILVFQIGIQGVTKRITLGSCLIAKTRVNHMTPDLLLMKIDIHTKVCNTKTFLCNFWELTF